MTLEFPNLRSHPANSVVVVDTYIAGETIRVVVDGIPHLEATNATDALAELRTHHDAFRRFVIEPHRGHGDVNAALLLPAYSGEATRAIVVASQFGFVPLAGTPLIASAVTALELKLVQEATPVTSVVFDTALGPVVTQVIVGEGPCRTGRWFTDAPAVLMMDHVLEVDDGCSIPVSLIVAGLPYIVVRLSDVGTTLSDIAAVGSAGRNISRAAGKALPMKDFQIENLAAEYPVLVFGDPEFTGPDQVRLPMAWIYPDGRIAKMPAGTGALAGAAFLNETRQCTPGTLITAVSPYGETIRSRHGGATDQAMVEADVTIVSVAVLI